MSTAVDFEKNPPAETTALPQRVLGKTGELVPILGLGTAPGGIGMEDEAARALFEQAIDLGLTYIDTAPAYKNAQKQLGALLQRRRSEVFLVTKTGTTSASEARRILEQSLQDLQTSQVDLTYVHSVGSLDVDEVLGKDGALEGLRQAQAQGLTRYVGFSAHNAPWKAARLLRQADVDVIMCALNPGDRHTYNFEAEVLPLARAQNAGVAAMKVYGGTRGMSYETPRPSALGPHDHQQALRYALSLPGVATAVIGIFNAGELLQNVQWAKDYTPLESAEKRDLDLLGRQLSSAWGPHYGPVR